MIRIIFIYVVRFFFISLLFFSNEIFSSDSMDSDKITKRKSTLSLKIEDPDKNIFETDLFREKDYLSKQAKKNKVSQYVIAGIALNESFGNILKVNKSEGSAGMFQFLAGTANDFKLKTYKNKRCLKSKEHGQDLVNLTIRYNNDISILKEIDERFDPKKSINACIKYIKKLLIKYNYNQDYALLHYNQGHLSEGAKNEAHRTNYVNNVMKFAKLYKKALEDYTYKKDLQHSLDREIINN